MSKYKVGDVIVYTDEAMEYVCKERKYWKGVITKAARDGSDIYTVDWYLKGHRKEEGFTINENRIKLISDYHKYQVGDKVLVTNNALVGLKELGVICDAYYLKRRHTGEDFTGTVIEIELRSDDSHLVKIALEDSTSSYWFYFNDKNIKKIEVEEEERKFPNVFGVIKG